MKIQSEATRDDLQKRLRRIEGQMRGIQQMLADDRDCQDIIQQLNASQAALRSATNQFMQSHARECLLRSVDELDASQRTALVDDLFGLLSKVK